jgi:hypothetical protein
MIESADERASSQRNFLLKLSPQLGHVLAEQLGGFVTPGTDSMESEIRDTLGLWMRLYHSGATATIKDASWWMSRFTDKYGRLPREEAVAKSDELSCFAIATIGLLLDQGILKFTKEPAIPKLVTSDYDPGNEGITKAILDRMEAALKKDKEKDK